MASAKKRRRKQNMENDQCQASQRDRTPKRTLPNEGRVASGIYRNGEQSLLVVSIKLLKATELAAKQKKASGAVNVEEVERQTAEGIVRDSLRRFASVPWFRGWLLDGENAPDGVYVASEAEIRRAAVAWDYGGIMGDLGQTSADYCKFFRSKRCPQGRFPVERVGDFLLWLFSDRKLEDWLFLKEWSVEFRRQLFPAKLRQGAGVCQQWYKRLMRDASRRRIAAEAVRVARQGRDPDAFALTDAAKVRVDFRKPIDRSCADQIRARLAAGESAVKIAAALGCCRKTVANIKSGDHVLSTIDPNTRRRADALVRFAKAARDRDAEARVREKGFAPSIASLRHEAKLIGVWPDVETWLYAGLRSLAGRNPESNAIREARFYNRGQIGTRVFLPFPLMRSFQQKAKPRWIQKELSRLETIPCFMLWFLDSVIPAPRRGRRCPYRAELGLAQQAAAPYRNDPSVLIDRALASVTRFPALAAQETNVQPEKSTPSNGEPWRSSTRRSAKPIGGPPSIDHPLFDAAVQAAIELCKSDDQKKLVEALAALTRDDLSQWPAGGVIAIKAGFEEADGKVYRHLNKLESRRAVGKRKSKQGWRIVGTY